MKPILLVDDFQLFLEQGFHLLPQSQLVVALSPSAVWGLQKWDVTAFRVLGQDSPVQLWPKNLEWNELAQFVNQDIYPFKNFQIPTELEIVRAMNYWKEIRKSLPPGSVFYYGDHFKSLVAAFEGHRGFYHVSRTTEKFSVLRQAGTGGFRRKIEKAIEFGTRRHKGPRVMFAHFNRTLYPLIKSVIKTRGQVHFLSPDWKFETRFVTGYNFPYYPVSIKNELKEKFMTHYECMQRYFTDNEITHFVVDRAARGDLILGAALLAAKYSPNIELILFDHGETGTEYPDTVFHRCWLYDVIYTGNTESRNYYDEVAKFGNFKVDIREWRRLIQIKRKMIRNNSLLYAPQFVAGEVFSQCYPDAARFFEDLELMKVLWETDMVWKVDSPGNLVEYPIHDFLLALVKKTWEHKRVCNIKYIDDKSFSKLLGSCRALLSDCVSTTAYDAAEEGIPTLCVRPEKASPVRKSVLEMFGPSIKIYDTPSEKHGAISQFLQLSKEGLWPIPKIPHRVDQLPWSSKDISF